MDLAAYLADAVALIHFYSGFGLPQRAETLFNDPDSDIAVSAATVWEINTKVESGKLPSLLLPGYVSLVRMLRDDGFSLLDVTPEIAEASTKLPLVHRDPFDRMLIATAIETTRLIISNDRAFERYDVKPIW